MRFLSNFLVAALLLIGAAIAVSGGSAAWAADGAGRTPEPHPPHGKGEHCVMPTEFMRRNHMLMMYAHRHNVVVDGIRTTKFNIDGCVNCHAVKGPDGQPVSFDNPKHFCRTCHAYAAVQIDCFECHNSKPQASDKSAALGADKADAAKMAAFLRETKK
jgi:[DsrC]-trisulfide reductase subunit J